MSGADLITIGEPLAVLVGVDPGPLRFGSRLELQVAGAELNVAVGISRLGHRAALIGCVGDDRLGRLALAELAAEGVQAAVRTVPGAPTGLLVRDLPAHGPTEVDYRRAGGAGAQLGPPDAEAASGLFEGARFLHVTGITPALSDACAEAVGSAVRLARQHRLRVSFDVNHRTQLWAGERAAATLAPLARDADLVLGSGDELALLTGEADPVAAARRLLDGEVETVVLKQGAAGATAFSREGQVHEDAEALAVELDPVGAGDAFAAGLLSGLLDDLALDRALRRGHLCAARVIATRGDLPGLLRRHELERSGTVR